jgi:predicted nucleic acid-binding protein
LTKVALNSSVIIALSTLGYLNKLKALFEDILIAKAVYEEICSAGQGLIGDRELEEAIKNHIIEVKEIKNQILVTALLDSIAVGEAETIALAIDEHADQIVLDDKAARRKAKTMKLNVIGTLRILRLMYDAKAINKTEFIHALDKLKEIGFRIDEEIVNKVKADL